MTTDRISSARLRLVPLTVADAAEMAGVLSGDALYAYTGGAPPGPDELRARYAGQAAGRSPGGREEWRNWILRRQPGGEAVGYLQATITGGWRRAEIAWVVGLAWQGQGYATEAARALVAWLDARGVQPSGRASTRSMPHPPRWPRAPGCGRREWSRMVSDSGCGTGTPRNNPCPYACRGAGIPFGGMPCSIQTGLEAATVVPPASMTRSTAKLSLLVSTVSVAAPPPAASSVPE